LKKKAVKKVGWMVIARNTVANIGYALLACSTKTGEKRNSLEMEQ